MKDWPVENKEGKWRYFPLFLILIFLVTLLILYLLVPSIFSGVDVREVPIRIDDDAEKVEGVFKFLMLEMRL